MKKRAIVFVAPVLDEPAARFLRALVKLEDVEVLGVVHRPPAPSEAKLFHDLERVARPLDPDLLCEAIATLRRRHGQPFRILGALEALQLDLALARERFGVPGERPKTALLFRDKARMKEALRGAGLPVARHRILTSVRDALGFAAQVGFPIVVKPLDGVGARATSRASDEAELARVVAAMHPSAAHPVLGEEMLVGDEYSFETLTVAGQPRAWSYSRYVPGCLEVLEKPWIQWACVLPREIDPRVDDEVRAMAFSALRALGMENGISHMEWFARSDGSLAIGEIAQRPPGPQLFQMTGLVNGVDVHLAWARAVVDGELHAPWNRTSAAGTVFVRGQGSGRVAGIGGLKELHDAIGPSVVETKLPDVGEPKGAGYEGDGYVVVQHRETKEVLGALGTVMRTLEIRYDGAT